MCKPSCCNPKKNSDSGVLAVVVLIVAAVVLAVKIAPFVVEAGRILATILEITLLATGSAAALAALIWAVIRLRGSQHRRQQPVIARQTERQCLFVPVSEQACLACGDKGHVIRVFGDGSVLARPCPECQPDQVVR